MGIFLLHCFGWWLVVCLICGCLTGLIIGLDCWLYRPKRFECPRPDNATVQQGRLSHKGG